MKRKIVFLLFVSLLISAATSSLFAQNLTGIWKGYFKSRQGDTYKLEFQLSHKNNAFALSGVSYSYLDIRFYGKATMTGNFIFDGKKLLIKEIKTVEVKSLNGNGTCIMNYKLEYSKSGKEEFLEGTYLGMNEKPNQKPDPYWGDCGGGIVFLRKVETSDFYPEPFLRQRATPTPKLNNPPIRENEPPQKTTPKPNTPPKNNTKPTPPSKNNTPNKPTKPELKEPTKPDVKKEEKKPDPPIEKKEEPKKLPPPPPVLLNRKNEITESLVVDSKKVTVKLYDNGEIDNDTISVYFDHKLVLNAKRLSDKPLTIELDLDQNGAEHELVMVAENLGTIPPNTSLMIVETASQRYRVQITSTEQKNAVVRFRYQSPNK